MKTLSALPGFLAAALLSLLVLSLTTAPVAAQTPPPAPTIKAPTPSQPDDPPVVTNILAMVLVVGLACGAALIPSKRGHQD